MNLFVVAAACVAAFTGTGCAYNLLAERAMVRSSASKPRDPKTGILRGAEPVFLPGSRDRAVLLIHGFIGSPSDFADFPQRLRAEGYTVSVPLLPGHGTTPQDFARTRPEEFEEFVVAKYRALKKEYREVSVVGLSMGGALGILLAGREKVDRLVLAAPYLEIAHQWYYVLPTEFYQAVFAQWIPYVYRPEMFKQVNRRDAVSKIVDYDYVPLRGAGACLELGARARGAVSAVACPALILHAKGDRATAYAASERLARSLGPAHCRLVTLTKSNHMIFWDYEKETVQDEIMKFLKSAPASDKLGP